MRRLLLTAALLVPLAGCTCGQFVSAQDAFVFGTCDPIERPLVPDSRFLFGLAAPDAAAPPTATSDAPDIIDVVVDEESQFHLFVGETGEAEVTVSIDGVDDTLTWEVVAPTAGMLRDRWLDIATLVRAEYGDETAGSVPDRPLPSPILVYDGQPVALELVLTDAQDRELGWSEEALTTSQEFGSDLEVVVEPGPVSIAHGDVELVAAEVASVSDLSGATLEIAAWGHPQETPPEEDDEAVTLGYVSAFVIDRNGDQVLQPPVTWRARGDAEVRPMDYEVGYPARTEITQVDLPSKWFDRHGSAEVCVTATLEGGAGPVRRSAWLGPDAVEVFDGPDCGGRACGCSAGATQALPAWSFVAGLGLVVALRRRREGAGRPCSGTASRTAA